MQPCAGVMHMRRGMPVAAPIVPHAQMMNARRLGAPMCRRSRFAGSCAAGQVTVLSPRTHYYRDAVERHDVHTACFNLLRVSACVCQGCSAPW